LRAIYESFCSFGSNRNLNMSSMDQLYGPTMDGNKFAKFTRDCKIIDGKNVTSTDVDILFNKCKAIGARRMDWEGFQYAFNELSQLKYPNMSQRDAYNALLYSLNNKGPIAKGTVPEARGIFDKLTDTTLYTGTHKLRFDERGHGRGLEGRDTISKTQRLDTLVERRGGHNMVAGTSNTFNKPAIADSYDRMNKVLGSRTSINNSGLGSYSNLTNPSIGSKNNIYKSHLGSHNNINKSILGSSVSLNRSQFGSNPGLTKPNLGSNNNFNKGSYKALNKSNANVKGSKGSVFDRLTDTQGYTGTHKNRFDAEGKGKGIVGRDYIPIGGGNGDYSGGDVKNLAQILRK